MITVNSIAIDEPAIYAEMQYHQAEDQREAMIKAGESLIVAELLRQRAKTLGLINESNTEDESFSELLFSEDLDYPEANSEDCEQYFRNNTNKFASSPLLEVRHILLSADPESDAERIQVEDQAKLIVEQLKEDPAQFDSLVKAHSACPSKEVGGQLGQLSKGQTVPEFERQVFSCEPGLVGQPISSRYGYHIVMVDRNIPGEPLEYSMVETKIRDYLNERVRRKAIAQYIHQLIAAAEIEGFDFGVSDSPLMN